MNDFLVAQMKESQVCDPFDILGLPKDIIVEILSSLPTKDIDSSRLVCHSMKQASDSEFLWKKKVDHYVDFIRQCPLTDEEKRIISQDGYKSFYMHFCGLILLSKTLHGYSFAFCFSHTQVQSPVSSSSYLQIASQQRWDPIHTNIALLSRKSFLTSPLEDISFLRNMSGSLQSMGFIPKAITYLFYSRFVFLFNLLQISFPFNLPFWIPSIFHSAINLPFCHQSSILYSINLTLTQISNFYETDSTVCTRICQSKSALHCRRKFNGNFRQFHFNPIFSAP